MKKFSDKLFICFSAKDRYVIAQPIVYHLKNYGINVWYDRYVPFFYRVLFLSQLLLP